MATPVPPTRLRLQPGVQPEQAMTVLEERIIALRNLPGSVTNTGPYYPIGRRDAYVSWVEDTEINLENLTQDRAVLELLHTARYWEIRNLHFQSARPVPLIDSEERWQRDALERLRGGLSARITRARGAPGHIAVLDSNVLLHHLLPDQVDWQAATERPQVRLILPLRVVEELDSKKYGPSDRLRERARRLLPKLEQLVGAGGAPAEISEGTTLEVMIEVGRRFRPIDADEEILDACTELRQFSGQAEDITLVTGDTAMRMRAEALGGIRAVALADSYDRNVDRPCDTSSA
jgi:hypothetical protein